MTAFDELPQEIVYEIFTYVPEYGHRVSYELHERSLDSSGVSAYCDFRRYCTRSIAEPLETCIEIASSRLSDDITDDATKYLRRNVHGLLFKYLYEEYDAEDDEVGPIIRSMLSDFGIQDINRLTKIGNTGYNHLRNAIVHSRWTKIYVNFYVSMILLDNKLITKKEFDRQIKVVNLKSILQCIIYIREIYDHISCLVIRYFRSVIPTLCSVPKCLSRPRNYADKYNRFIKIIELPIDKYVPAKDAIAKDTTAKDVNAKNANAKDAATEYLSYLMKTLPEQLEGFSRHQWISAKVVYMLDIVKHMNDDID